MRKRGGEISSPLAYEEVDPIATIVELVREVVEPVIQAPFELVDIEYGKIGSDMILSIFVDKPEGITLNDTADLTEIISLPAVEILSVDLENIEVYDIQTGSFNLLPMDKSVFKTVQEEAKRQVLRSACKAEILEHTNRQAQTQLENLFALTQTKVSVYPAAVGKCG